MNNKLILIFIFWFPLISIYCSKDEEPIIIPEIPKDPRTYTWSMDTVGFPQTFETYMFGVWGSSENDVYMVGLSDNRDKLYHYDGEKWDYILLNTDWGGGIVEGAFELYDVFGFSKDDVWIAGMHFTPRSNPSEPVYTSRLILHFNGTSWYEMNLPPGEGLNCLWGGSSNNLFAAGIGKYIWHYNGIIWKKDSLPVTIIKDMYFICYSITGNKKGEVFLIAGSHQNLPRDINYFFIYSNEKWILKDSTIIDLNSGKNEQRWGDIQLWVSPEDNLYSVRPFYKWDGNKWNLINGDLRRAYSIFGTNENNIFTAGIFGEVYHYNGTNWKQITDLFNQNITYYGIWANSKEVFIVGSLDNKTVVLHGK